MRDQLLGASPYLSDTVMVNAAAKEDVLPNSIITEILSENPQSAKAENVLNTLNARTNPPNANQMAQIRANDTVVGHKESLESKRDYYSAVKAREVYRLIRMFGSDTAVSAKHDSIETALSNIATPSAMYKQAFCRFNKGDSAGVINLLNNIPSEFDLTAAETDYHNYFEDYFEVLLTLQWQEKHYGEVDSSQKAVLYDIMNNSHGQLQAFARNLLIYTDGLTYNEPYLNVDTSQLKTVSAGNNNVINENVLPPNSYLKLYPNPAREYITLEYNLDYGTTNAVIEILDINGVHVEAFRLAGFRGVKIIDLRNRQSGTYLIRLAVNGKTLQHEKFVKH